MNPDTSLNAPGSVLTVNGLRVFRIPRGFAPMRTDSCTEDGESVYETSVGGQWVTLTVSHEPECANLGGFRLTVEVGHPECEESPASLTVYGYEFPGASEKVRRFLLAVTTGEA